MQLSECLSNLQDIFNNELTDWEEYCQFSDTIYQRNLAFRNELLDCYILCWNPNQGTPYHYHPSRGCIYKILKGSLLEIRPNNRNASSYHLSENDSSYIDNKEGSHKIINISNEPAISLHFYSPSKFYDDTS